MLFSCFFFASSPRQEVSVSCSKTANCSYSIACYSICTICTKNSKSHFIVGQLQLQYILIDVTLSGTQEHSGPWSPIIFQPNAKKINSAFTHSGQCYSNWIKYYPLSASSYLALHQACTATCRVVI